MSIRSLTLAILVASRLAGLPTALALPPQFQVNSYTTAFQGMPSVAADAAGNFVVVWSSNGSGVIGIQGQRFDSSGMPQGDEFQVNSYTSAGQNVPAVATDAAGNFVVVWQGYGSPGSDTSDRSIQGRRFDITGTPQGDQFQINSYTTNFQGSPVVASDGAGNFVVMWQSYGSAGSDTSGPSIQGQRFDSTGTPQGGEFQVNSFTTSYQVNPAVASDGAGNFVVVWQSGYGGYSVQAQRYDSAGMLIGSEFKVNSYTTGFQRVPAVASDALGNFVVAWERRTGIYGFYSEIWGRRFNSAGTPQGDDFQIKGPAYGGPAYGGTKAGVRADADGNFIVVWGDTGNVWGRRYDGTGPQSPEFQINTYTPDYQAFGSAPVAIDGLGNFVVVWASGGSEGSDTSGSSVQARRFTALTELLVPGRMSIIKPNTLAKFVSKPVTGDTFALPTADPVVYGGALRIFDTATTAGDDTYALPPSGWKGLGTPPGSKGYKYKGGGTPADPCRVVLVRAKIIKALCLGSGVTLTPPFAGDVGIVLSLGLVTTDRYCARFGGDESRNDATLTKRKDAPAPGACP